MAAAMMVMKLMIVVLGKMPAVLLLELLTPLGRKQALMLNQRSITCRSGAPATSTIIPAEIIGMSDTLGKIQPDYVANMVRLDKTLHVKGVWTSGRQIA